MHSLRLLSPLSMFAAIALPLAGLAACVEPAAHASVPAEQRTIAVQLAEVTRGPVTRTLRAAGVLHRKHDRELSFKVPGIVTRVAVEEGARVKKGQLLALIDPTELEAGTQHALESVAKAERDLARVRALHEGKSVPRSMLDDAETGVALARAQAASASFNLKHAALVAPEDGVVEQRMAEVGEVVPAMRPIVRFKSARGGNVIKVNLVDREALALVLGGSAEVVLDARPEETRRASIERIATSASPATGTFEVELALAEADALPSGLTAKVSFLRSDPDALSVPLTALVDGDGERASLFTLEGERAKRIPVRVDYLTGERATLREGPAEHTQVISAGAADVRDGAHVRVVK